MGLKPDISRDWTFKSADVAAQFDSHVREQLPWYDHATGAIAHLVRHYLPYDGLMYDVGCATGNIGRAVADTVNSRKAQFVGIDNSDDMLGVHTGPGRVVCEDALTFEFEPCDVVICFLTVMFLPVHARPAFLQRIVEAVRPGGLVVVFDKVTSTGGYVGTCLSRLTLAGKLAAGVASEEIVAKELSLAGVQRPLDPRLMDGWIEWFRFGEFAGWLTER